MRKTLATLIWLAVAVNLGTAQSAKPEDLSGTWKGFAVVPTGDRDEVTLVMEKSGQTYTGRLNDTLGMLINAEIRNFNREADRVTFEFDGQRGSEVLAIKADLALEGNVMKGIWLDLSGGDSNVLELARVPSGASLSNALGKDGIRPGANQAPQRRSAPLR